MISLLLSEPHLKKHTGITLHQAVRSEKMNVAKRLFRETDLSVCAVAESVVFPGRSRFCTAFCKHTGYPPTENRKG